jgi:hypothetical protein
MTQVTYIPSGQGTMTLIIVEGILLDLLVIVLVLTHGGTLIQLQQEYP